MKQSTKRVLSGLLVVALFATAVSIGAMAAPTITDDSDLEDEDLVYVDPSGDAYESLVFEFDTADPVDLTVDDNETELLALEGLDDEDDAVSVDEDEYTVHIDHYDLANEEDRNVSETYDVDVEITDGAEDKTITMDLVMISSSDQSTVMISDEIDEADGLDLSIEDASDGLFGLFAEEFDTFESSNNHGHGADDYNSTTYKFDGDTADAYDAAAEDVDEGDPVIGMTVFVQDQWVPVYADESGDYHGDNDSYAVYDTDESELEVYFGEDREDALSSDVTVVNNDLFDETSLRSAADAFGWTTTLDLWILG